MALEPRYYKANSGRKPWVLRGSTWLPALFLVSFAASRTWAAAINSAGTGNWSNPATWSPAQVPTAADTVDVLAGHVVTLDIATASAGTTTIAGTLVFSTVVNSSLTLSGGNVVVNAGGSLLMGTPAQPVPAGTFAHLVLASGTYAGQFGLIVNAGGNFTVRGSTKSPWGFASASIPAAATNLTISASSSTNWAVGDIITIGPTSGNGPARVWLATVTAVSGLDPNTVSFAPAIDAARVLTATSPIVVANLTSNVLVRSSGTNVSADTAYIRNLARNTTSFYLAYGEFAYLGANAAGKYGITFDGSGTKGAVSSSTIRNGFTGVRFQISSGNTLARNNFFANSSKGVDLEALANGNILSENTSHGNSASGILINGSQYNLVVANNAYANSGNGGDFAGTENTGSGNNFYANTGMGINNTLGRNTLYSNNVYANSTYGITCYNPQGSLVVANNVYGGNTGVSFTGGGTLWIGNHIYANSGVGLTTDHLGPNTFTDGSIGYDGSGNSRPNLGGEVSFSSDASSETLVFKGMRVGSSGVGTFGINVAGTSLLSYNQDYATGTVRLWGDYAVSGATLTLDYASQLYASTATVPKLMRGTAHSASVASTNDTNAVSQLITLRYDLLAANWRVEGSSSGLLGTFAGSIANQPFPSSSPQFNLTFTQGGSPEDGDLVDFALLAASKDQNLQKKLLFGPANSAFNGGRSKLVVDPTGGLVLTGAVANPTLVDMISGGTYYSLVSSGSFTMAYATMSNTDSDGLQLSGGAGVAVSSSVFDLIGKNAGTASYITARDLASNATFYNVAFNLSRSTSGLTNAYNILAQGSDANLNWTVIGSPVGLWGESYNYDPNSKIAWTDTTCLPRTSGGSGNWSDPATWFGGVPNACSPTTVQAGHVVTLDSLTATAGTTTVNGTLAFSRVASSSLTLVGGNLTVSAGGTLDLGAEASPIPTGVNAHLVLSSGTYAGQYGLIVNAGGNFTVRGSTKTPYSYATQDITTADTSLTVYGSTSTDGWQAGDVITIGPTSDNGPTATSSRTIASITGGPVYTVAWSGGVLSAARALIDGPIIVANLTRNALVRSSGTVVSGAGANSAYIQNLARNTTSFTLAHGEFAYLGANLTSKYGIEFYGSATRGAISSSTVRDGYRGIYLNSSSGNALTGNNVYGNAAYGITVEAASGNILTGNNFYSNTNRGIYLNNSSNNTLTGNNSHSNSGVGIYFSGSSNNTLTGNNFYSNSNYGIFMVSSSDGNTLIGNNSYSNSGYGIYINDAFSCTFAGNYSYANLNRGMSLDSGSAVFVGGGLGYDRAGRARPNSPSDLALSSSGAIETLVLKGTRVNPTPGISVAGMSNPGTYLLSYNQDYATGTVRLWGDYQLAGSTVTLDYATQLYASTNTAPKLMRGTGHSITAVLTKDAATLSELLTVTAVGGGNWRVEGSSSGVLNAAFNCPSGACAFTHAKVDFTLNVGGTLNAGDALDFVTTAASADANRQKQLLFGPSASTFNGGRSKLEVDPTGGLVLTGTAANPTLVDMISGGTYYSLVSSGAFTMAYASMSNTDSGGLQLSGNAGVSISSSAFDFIGKNAGVASYITARDLTSNATFYNVAFNLSRSTSGLTAYNARVEGSDAGLWWSLADATGPFSGATYEYDPNGRVRWTETVAPAAIGNLFASTGTLSGTIALAWSAPGNNGATGTLNAGSQFLVQYTTDSAFSAWSPTAAQPAHVFRTSISTSGVTPGSAQGYQLGGLAPGATHHLRMFTSDESGNWSSVSNAAISSSTIDSIAPGAVTDLAAVPGAAEGGITLTWTSPGNDGYTRAISAGQFLIALSTNAADLTSAATNQAQIVIATAAAPGTLQTYTTGTLLLATSYYFRIWTADETPMYSTLSNGATAQARQFTPLPPASLAAASTTGQIALTWASPATPPAPYIDHYELSYSSVAQAGPYNSLGSVSSTTPNYLHSGLANETTYFYRVLTADTGGLASAPAEAFAVTPDTVAPAAAGSLSGTLGTATGDVLLSWTASGDDGGTGILLAGSRYAIQYSTDNVAVSWSTANAQVSFSTSGVSPGAVQGRLLTGLTQTTTYYVRIWTADPALNWSAPSSTAAVFDSTPPGAVTDLSASPGAAEGGITLTWTSPGNDGDSRPVTAGQFLIAWSTNAADLTSAATSQAKVVVATAAAPGTLQSYTTGSLLLATSYYFRVWTRDEVPLYSSLSNGATAQARQFTPLPPASFAASQIVGQITLTWAAPSTPPAPYLDHYEISYSTVAQTGPYTALASISSEVFTYAHTSLLNRTTYYYRALTADTGGLKSAPSENFAVTPDTVPPSAATDLSASLGAGLNEIELQWTTSGDDGMTGTLGGGSRYAIQYTTDAVGVVWNTANAQVVFSTSGVSPGAVQRRTLTGLTQSSTYYVRLWTGDPALNWSVASNISTATPRQPGPVILSLLPAAGASGVSRTATVTVTFDKTVSYAALNAVFSLTLVRDASGNTVSVPAAGTLSPASNAAAFTFTPAAALAGNGVYMVSITTDALDVQGNPLQAAASAQFTTIMDRNTANSIVVAALGLTITVPAGALAADGYIQASTTAVSAAVTEANRKLISNSGDSSRAPVTGTIVDLTVYDALGAVQPGTFGAPVTVAMTYPDADGDGLVDGAAVPVRADTLGVWWLDEAASLWVRLPASSADLQAKRVTAATSHFTTFALIGQAATGLSDAYPYPVPFRPSKGHTKITFTGLGQTTRIRIFTVAGDKVADLTSSSIDGKYDWGVVNSAGQPVASGVYLYLLESGSNSKKGKLVVIR